MSLLVDRDRRPVEELLDREPLGGDARRLAHLQRPLRRRPLVRARADQLEQARRRLDAEVALERRLDRVGDVRRARSAAPERAGELREPHQRAEVARREGRAPLLLDRLDVDAGRAARRRSRRSGLAPAVCEPLEDLGREPLRVAVAEDEDRVVALASRKPVERRIHRLHRRRPRPRPRGAARRRGWRRASSCRCRRRRSAARRAARPGPRRARGRRAAPRRSAGWRHIVARMTLIGRSGLCGSRSSARGRSGFTEWLGRRFGCTRTVSADAVGASRSATESPCRP